MNNIIIEEYIRSKLSDINAQIIITKYEGDRVRICIITTQKISGMFDYFTLIDVVKKLNYDGLEYHFRCDRSKLLEIVREHNLRELFNCL